MKIYAVQKIKDLARVFWKELAYVLRKIFRPRVISNNGVSLVAKHPAISDHMRNVLYHNDYELPELQILRRTLDPGSRVLEIGGGIGYLSTHLSRKCGDDNVIMVEANPALAPIIDEIHGLNAVHPTVINRVATCDDSESVTLYLAENFWSTSTVEGQGDKAVLPAVNLNTLVEEFKPSYLILDVEGAETEIVPMLHYGGIEKILVELHPHRTGDAAANQVVRQLIDAGFLIDFHLSARNQIYGHR